MIWGYPHFRKPPYTDMAENIDAAHGSILHTTNFVDQLVAGIASEKNSLAAMDDTCLSTLQA